MTHFDSKIMQSAILISNNSGKDAESSRKQRQENAIELRKNKREGIY